MNTSQMAWFMRLTFHESRRFRPLSQTANSVPAEVTKEITSPPACVRPARGGRGSAPWPAGGPRSLVLASLASSRPDHRDGRFLRSVRTLAVDAVLGRREGNRTPVQGSQSAPRGALRTPRNRNGRSAPVPQIPARSTTLRGAHTPGVLLRPLASTCKQLRWRHAVAAQEIGHVRGGCVARRAGIDDGNSAPRRPSTVLNPRR